MDDEQYNDSERLIERFRNCLGLPLTERYFDEDELIDIFDNAGDLEDDFLRLEVLSVASRFHPDSEALNRRRCLFYHSISESAGAQYLSINARDDDPMWRIIDLKHKRGLSDVDLENELDKLLMSVDRFDDEESVIQLIRLVAELNRPHWLSDNLEELIKRCENEKVVLFESAAAFETMQEYEMSVKLLLRLTDIDPFGCTNWLMLAEQYFMLNNDEGFYNAIEYALALDPESWQAMYVKAKFAFTKEDYTTARDLLEKACRIEPYVLDLHRYYAYTLKAIGLQDEAEKTCRKMLNIFPASVLEIIPDILMFSPKDAGDLLNLFYRNNPDNSENFWRTWSDNLWDSGYCEMAVASAKCFKENSGTYTMNLVVPEFNFRNNIDPNETLEWLEAYISGRSAVSVTVDYCTYYIIKIITLARMGLFNMAMEECSQFYSLSLPKIEKTVTRTLADKFAPHVIRMLAIYIYEHRDPEDYKDLSVFDL